MAYPSMPRHEENEMGAKFATLSIFFSAQVGTHKPPRLFVLRKSLAMYSVMKSTVCCVLQRIYILRFGHTCSGCGIARSWCISKPHGLYSVQDINNFIVIGVQTRNNTS